MNGSQFINNTDMNFYKIFLDGLSNHFNQIDLESYCRREFNKAKDEYYTAESFFEPLLKLILVQRIDINKQVIKEMDEIKYILNEAKQNGNTVLDYYSQSIERDSDEWNEYQRKFNEGKLEQYQNKLNNYSIDNVVINDFVTMPLLDEFEKAIRKIYTPEKETPTIKEMNLDELDEWCKPDRTTKDKLMQLKSDLRNLLPIYNKYHITAVAHIIYESDVLHKNTKPKSFNAWKKTFIEIAGSDPTNNYKPSHALVQSKISEMKNTFYYLFPNT